MGVKGSIDGIVGGARHMAVGAALLAGLGLASAGCDLFTNPSSPTATPVPPPAAAAPAAPAPTDTPAPAPTDTPFPLQPTATRTPVPPSPTPSPSPSPTSTRVAIAATASVTATAAVPATPAATPPAPPLAATATPPGYPASTATPSYIVVTATPAGLVPGVVLTPYSAPPRVAATATPPLPRYEPLNGGYFPTSRHPASPMQTDGNDPLFALETLARFNGEIQSGLESVLSAHYPGRAVEVRSWASAIRGLLDYAVKDDRSDGRVFHKFVLHNFRLTDGSQRYMLEVQRCAPGLPWVNCQTTYAPISAGVFNRVSSLLASVYGWHPDELAPKPLKP